MLNVIFHALQIQIQISHEYKINYLCIFLYCHKIFSWSSSQVMQFFMHINKFSLNRFIKIKLSRERIIHKFKPALAF
jgi:hypothetical protein